jgi:cytochrome b
VRLWRVRIWDLPTRLFHWLVVGLFAFSWWTAESDRLDWHILSGYAILALVVFRIYWGFVGSDTARFTTFLKGPRTFFAYSRRLLDRPVHISQGHNPMGGWSVIALIALLLLQAGLGLFAIDVDGINAGPLDNLVSFETGRRAAGLHGLVFNILLMLTALHVAAVLYYWLWGRDNLIDAMITGAKLMPGVEPPRATRFAPLGRAVLGLIAAALLVACVVLWRF